MVCEKVAFPAAVLEEQGARVACCWQPGPERARGGQMPQETQLAASRPGSRTLTAQAGGGRVRSPQARGDTELPGAWARTQAQKGAHRW